MIKGMAGLVGAAATAIAAVQFAGAAMAADKVVKVGLTLAMSGPVAGIGESVNRGAGLYHKLHRKDLPKGLDIDVLLRDDTGSSDAVRRIAQELIVRDKVQILAGGALSPQAFTLAPLLTQAKVPLVIMNASTARIPRESPYIVRVSNTLWQTSYTLGEWAAKKGYKKAYTLAADYAAGIDAEAGFIRAFTENGGTVVGSVHTPMATTDYLPFMQPIKETGADAIFLFVNAGRTNAAVKAFAGSGLKQAGVQLMGPGDVAIDDEIATMSDDVLDLVTAGVYLTSNPRPQNQDFVRAWKAEYGRDALPNFMAAAGWDGMAAIYALVRETKGEFTGDTAMKFLAGWKNPDSPRGSIAIDPQTRDIVQTVYINRVQKVDGKPTNVTFDTIADVRDPWKRLNPQ